MEKLETSVKPMDKVKTLEVAVDDGIDIAKCRQSIVKQVNIMGAKYPAIFEIRPAMQCYYCSSYVPYGSASFCQNQKVGTLVLKVQK
jgi:hypothetical protein